VRGGLRVVVAVVDFEGSGDSAGTGRRTRPGRTAYGPKPPFAKLAKVETLTAVYDRRPVCFACSRVPPSPTSNPPQTKVAFDVATRMNIKGGTDKPTPNQTLPFRERLGCSPREACVALGVGRTFLYQLIAERRVEVTKLGRRTIVSIPSLLKLLDGQA